MKSHQPQVNGQSISEALIIVLFTSILTTFMTFATTSWQLRTQHELAEKTHFIDSAQTTMENTGRILDDGYSALVKLVKATDEKGWKEFAETSWQDYMDFHRRWRQQLIIEHFKISRYFGKDIADQLIHVDHIDLHPLDNLASLDPCEPPGDEADFDLEKLARQTECTTRMIAVNHDLLYKTTETSEILSIIDGTHRMRDFAGSLLQHYEKQSVIYLRQLNMRLTQLGKREVQILLKKQKT